MNGARLKLRKEDNISKFKRLHPKATANLSDDEIQMLGDQITKIHTDNTAREFSDVFSDPSGQRYMLVQDGESQTAIPLLKSQGVNNG